MIERCSVRDCDNAAQRIVKVLDAGYCIKHWKEVSGNLDHFPVTRLYPCQFCRWMFASNDLLKQHVETVHVKGGEIDG
jgi:hypothetical protein